MEHRRAERHLLGNVQDRPERGPVRREHGMVRGEHPGELQGDLDAFASTSLPPLHRGRLSYPQGPSFVHTYAHKHSLSALRPSLVVFPRTCPAFLLALRSHHAGLQVHSMTRTAACAVNNSTNTYCYIDALGHEHGSPLPLPALARAASAQCTVQQPV